MRPYVHLPVRPIPSRALVTVLQTMQLIGYLTLVFVAKFDEPFKHD